MSNKPNILVITGDHWPASLLGCAGHDVIQTPTLDHLSRNGVRFTNAYTECPVCIPARRTLLTGTTPRTHGDRTFQVELPMPSMSDMPTFAQVFRDNEYQAFAAGKLHVYPPRARAGFDEVMLSEEGRPQLGPTDDYEIYLGDQGHAGEQFLHGMSNNDYVTRPWHLDERHHVTNWTTRQMSRFIQRRDPTRPSLWYLSYTHPHPPLVPPQTYLDMYGLEDIDLPYHGTWPVDHDQMPAWMNNRLIETSHMNEDDIRRARRAFYALCTHIDHQMRVVLGTIREEGLLDNTIIVFLADHGDMLGNHNLWAKRMFYQDSAAVPMILVGAKGDKRVPVGVTDNRLVGLQDVMPTILDLCGIEIPESVDGLSMVGEEKRSHMYGEYGEGFEATRMIHDGRFKLVYYAAGNRLQLFDVENDPQELTDLISQPDVIEVQQRLTGLLITECYGSDLDLIQDGNLVGLAAPPSEPPERGLSLQRGSHWPVPPQGTGPS